GKQEITTMNILTEVDELAPHEAWHIRAVRLPDGEHAEDWWIHEGRLYDQPIRGARDLPGGWALPGLVDAHAHLSLDFGGARLCQGSDELIAANLEAHSKAGVLVVRDTGMVPGARIDRRLARGPHILTAGRFLAPAGRYHAPLYKAVGPEQLVAAALAEVADGATWVKVIADFPGPDGNWFAPRVNYAPDALRALVSAAHDAGARVAAHVSGPFVAEVVRAGVDSIEHGPLIDADLLTVMAQRGTAWTPTLLTVAGVLDQLAMTNSSIGAQAREALARLNETLPLAAQFGVPILAGTDESPPGSVAREVAQLRRFGLSAVAALAAASTAARAYLGLPAFSASADLVTFAADPRSDPEALAKPAAVVRAGRRIV
ncbi:MAG TPA: amidohydrolase family protein, partial [Roseiflexaceae bacterium]